MSYPRKIQVVISFFKKYRQIIPFGLLLLTSAVSFQNCSPVSFSEQTLSQDPIISGCVGANCEPGAPLTCLFNGEILQEGAAVTAFLNSAEPYGKRCVYEERICRQGILSGSYNYATCSVGDAASCLFNGQTIANGQTVRAYLSSSAPSNGQCVEEMRTCNNGILSGSYNYATCSVAAPASCLFNGQTIAHGQSVTAFQNSSVPYGSSCVNQARQCNNGILSGSYNYGTCSVATPASCLFNGQTIAHGQTVKAFQAPSVPYGSSCVDQVRTCHNGVLSGSYAYNNCSVNPQPPQASCQWYGATVPDGQSVKAYAVKVTGDKATKAGYIWEPIAERRTCKNGTLGGSFQCQSWAQIYGWADCIIYYWWDEIPKDAVLVPVSE